MSENEQSERPGRDDGADNGPAAPEGAPGEDTTRDERPLSDAEGAADGDGGGRPEDSPSNQI